MLISSNLNYSQSIHEENFSASAIFVFPEHYRNIISRIEFSQSPGKFEKILHRNKITDCGIKEILGGETNVAEKLSVESDNAGADLVIVADKGRNVFLFTAVRKYY